MFIFMTERGPRRLTDTIGGQQEGTIEFAVDQEFLFIIKSDATTQKGYYRLLDRHILKPLQEKTYLEIEKVGRKKYVTLSEDGKNALRAFRYAGVDTRFA